MRKWEDPSRHQKLVAGAALDTPLYKEVKRLLTETISAGEWMPGSAIPAEWKLAERFKVAIGTVRKAVDELVVPRARKLVRHRFGIHVPSATRLAHSTSSSTLSTHRCAVGSKAMLGSS